jgi:hypothetical protein
MELDGYVQALTEDLARVAAVGDEPAARAAQIISAALEPAFGRRLQQALSEAALELSSQLADGHVEVRIAGSDPELVYVATATPAPAEPTDEALDARITLRLPNGVKSRVEAAAAASGSSVNSWLVQSLIRALDVPPSTSRHRLSGYGRS